MADRLNRVFTYHEATKHRLHRYAQGPGGLDWANQPDPFRRYAGAPLITLDHITPGDEPRFETPFVEGHVAPQPLNRATISQLFYDSLALSAWKQVGKVRWSLRVDPSSGNLHPTEGYLLCGPVTGLCERPMVCHYAPKAHALEVRADVPLDRWRALTARLPSGAILVGLTSIHWREAWKYGERAFRYCQHDAGHVIATVTLAAAGLGWKAALLDDGSTDEVAGLLGVFDPQGAEPEEPECLLAVYPQGHPCEVRSLPVETLAAFRTLPWQGRPNRLSAEHVIWPIIDDVTAATRKPATHRPDAPADAPATPAGPPLPVGPPLPGGSGPISFRKIIHQRRSCLALDGRTGIVSSALYQLLRKTLPGPGQVPFTALPWGPTIDFGLFVHRVQDLDPGLYYLARDPARLPTVKRAMKPEFAWEKPNNCPEGVAFYRLLTGDARELAQQIACHQEIAAAGCFSLGMIAAFEEPLGRYGPWFYRRLFWEAGVIGQVLYLEAEALGIRGTGIGCYFDDPMHAVLGLTDRRFQNLYHFTVGGPVEDPRLTTLPAYPPDRGDRDDLTQRRVDLP